MKKVLKSKASKAWFITSCALAALLVGFNVALAVPTVKSFGELVFGYQKGTSTGEGNSAQYYKKTTASKEEARAKGDKFNISLAQEGIVLLKNKAKAFPMNLKTEGNKVSVFGKNSAKIVYGGSGSGAVDTDSAKTLHDSLTAAGFEVNPTLEAFYASDKSGSGRPNNPSDLDSGKSVSLSTGETPYASYTEEVKQSYTSYNDLALVVLSRIGGEGFDLPRTSSEEGKHYLELDKNEEDLLKNVTSAGFKKVCLVINSGNAMELGFAEKGELADKIDGVFFMPGTGTTGVMALGQILTGAVNPSGHTVDTFATDFTKNPTFQNFGDNAKEKGDEFVKSDGNPAGYYFVDYEEGIYVGYRYYETRAAKEGEAWYQDNVVYPFGYGLSYTTFSYSIANKEKLPSKLSKDGKFTVDVTVKNTGDVAGKAVVELYGSAPYTTGGIPKSAVQLVGFGKTSLLSPNQEETVSIEVDPYLMASYDAKDANKDGFKGYTLEAGNYTFSVRTDAHTAVDSFALSLDKTETYEKDPLTGTEVKNLYTDNKDPYLDSDFHLQTTLSRDDFGGTFPKAPEAKDYQLSDDVLSHLKDRTPNNPNQYEKPNTAVAEEDKNLKLYDLFEKNKDGTFKLNEFGAPYIDYDNPKWGALLNLVSFADAKNHLNKAAFHTIALTGIDKPRTYETDGPAGFVNFMFKSEYYGTAAYCSEVLIGQTYNQDLVEEWGSVVGEEGLWGDTKAGFPYTGWYAPGMNIHRSPFGGRNFEYYSEDPVHTGKMAVAQIRGARKKGVYCFAKHFALNEQETHRQSNGDISFVTEQAMREVYLKGFEIAVKEGKAMGIMSSFNRIGVKWTGGDYRLLTTILRDEWGFHGTVIDDFNTPSYMSVKQMCYAGGDINLSATRFWDGAKEDDANDYMVVRKALKNALYTVGNSAAMNGHGEGIVNHPGMANYIFIQIAVDVAIPLAIIVWGLAVFFVQRKKHPDAPVKAEEKKQD